MTQPLVPNGIIEIILFLPGTIAEYSVLKYANQTDIYYKEM